MRKKITNNIGLKLLALVVAIALWLVVVNIDDPIISNTYSGIPVEVLNAETLTDQGKVYEVLNKTDVITVTVTGKRSILDALSKENIRATADLKDLTLVDTVAISLSTNKNNNQIEGMKSDITALQLSIEDLMTKHFSVSVETTGEPEEGYVIGNVTSNLNTVAVSGPASVVSSIDSVKGVVSVAGRNSDMTTTSSLKCYNAQGELIDHGSLNISATNVSVGVEILATKAVEVHYGYEGETAEGFMVSGQPTSDRNAIYLSGRSDVLRNITVIEVPAEAVSVEGAREEVVKKINLHDYLPEGVEFADPDFLGNVTVRVPVEKTDEISATIEADKITIRGLPDGLSAKIVSLPEDEDEIAFTAEGLPETLETVELQDVTGVVDLQALAESLDVESLTEGEYEVEVKLILPEGFRQKGSLKVLVILKNA